MEHILYLIHFIDSILQLDSLRLTCVHNLLLCSQWLSTHLIGQSVISNASDWLVVLKPHILLCVIRHERLTNTVLFSHPVPVFLKTAICLAIKIIAYLIGC